MKHFLSIIFIVVLSFGFISCDKEEENPNENNGQQLVEAKADAIEELEAYVGALNEADYAAADWNKIQTKLVETKTAIESCTNENTLSALLSSAKTYIDSIEKQDLLGDAKAAAIQSLNVLKATFSSEDYTEATWVEVEKVFTDAFAAINSATTIEQINSIVNKAKNNANSFPSKEEELVEQLRLAIVEAAVKLNEEFLKYNANEYDPSDYAAIESIRSAAEFAMGEAKTVEEVQPILDKAIADMAAVKKLIFITYVNIEDSTWIYESILAIREDLLKDYNTATEKSYTFEDLPMGAWVNTDFHKMFYAEIDGVKMQEKWGWIAEYFATVGGSSNKGPCGKLNDFTDGDAFHNNNINVNIYAVSYEFRGFIVGKQFTSNKNFMSADYSLESVNNRVWDFLGAQKTYKHGTTYVLPEPARKYQEFLGWYDNPEFTGDPITQITEASSSLTLYAKWSDLTDEGEVEIHKEALVAEIKAYLESSKDQTKYSAEAWATVEAALADGIAAINEATTKEEADTLLANYKAALDAIAPTNFVVEYELNGGHWYYATKKELVEAFLTDFSNHKGNAVTAVTFFDQSFNTAYGFFTKYTQWQWLLTYLGTIATEHTGDLVVSDGGMARARIEIAGYLASGVAKNSDETFVSFDYSAYANDLGFGEYLKQASFEYVEEVTLLTPIKDGYKFMGWYDNAEFTGEPVATASAACKLYAKFETLTDEDILNAHKKGAKEALDQYVEETKDFKKFSEADKVAFGEKVEELKGTIDAAASITDVDAALVSAKAVVDAYAYSTYVVNFELNGGHWYYADKEALIADFMADFNTLRATTTRERFFDTSWTNEGVITTFFTQFEKWHWFLAYLGTICDPAKTQYFALGGSDIQMPHVRAEIEGYFNNKQYQHATYSTYQSSDYTGKENDLGFAECLKFTTQEYLEPQTEMPVVYRDGYTLVGWYDNAEFTGEAVTSITGATKLYAKWEAVAE